jgi:hypothetical protein
MIPNTRSQEEHDIWTRMFLTHLVLGPVEPWAHPEFLALREGFDIPLTGQRNDGPRFISVCSFFVGRPWELTSTHHVQTLGEVFNGPHVPALVAAMFDRHLTSVDQLTNHLEFKILRGAGESTDIFKDIFHNRLEHYLHGVGHPNHPTITSGSILPLDTISKDANNALLRARALLLGATDSELLPAESRWALTVSPAILMIILCLSTALLVKFRFFDLDSEGGSLSSGDKVSSYPSQVYGSR